MDGKVAILGCARDCARYLPLSLQNAKKIGRMFGDYRIFIMENDSLDGTTDILMKERKDPRVSVFMKNHLSWSLCPDVLGGLLIVGIIFYKS